MKEEFQPLLYMMIQPLILHHPNMDQKVVDWLLFPGLLTEIQCKSKRLRKNTKAPPLGECAGQQAYLGPDPSENKQVTSTTMLHKVSTTCWMGHCVVFDMMG